jgi:hypothetical protein
MLTQGTQASPSLSTSVFVIIWRAENPAGRAIKKRD